jgi:hypothetical protein
MNSLNEIDTIIPTDQCSRTLFTAQRDKLADLMRGSVSPGCAGARRVP